MINRNQTLAVILIAITVIPIMCAPTVVGQRKPREPKETQAIRAVLDRQVEAWNRRDLEGFMEGYWKSPDLTFYSGGTKTSSWQATIDRYRNRYQSEGREMGHLDFTEIEIEMLGARAAFVRGKWNLKMESGDVGGLFTLILRKLPEGWKIVHDHTGSSS